MKDIFLFLQLIHSAFSLKIFQFPWQQKRLSERWNWTFILRMEQFSFLFFFSFFMTAAQRQCDTSERPLFSAALPGNHPVGAIKPWGERKWLVTSINCLSFFRGGCRGFCSHKKQHSDVIFHSHGSSSFLRLRLAFLPVLFFFSSASSQSAYRICHVSV